MVKNIDSSIYFNKIKSMVKSSKGKNIFYNRLERFQLVEVFDTNKFINDRDFHNDKKYLSFLDQFSRTLMFMEFLERYIRDTDNKPKYKFIKNLITILNTKENGKNLVKDINREYIKDKLISYYKV